MPSEDEDTRTRSASPPREQSKPKASSKGFKWKEKRPRDEDSESRTNDGRLERGYRDRSPRRDRYRDAPRVETEGNSRYRDRSPQRRQDGGSGGDGYRPDRDIEATASSETKRKEKKKNKDKPAKEKKEKKPKVDNSEPMIVVNVNDRLGTKAGIPCLASDSVKAFKAMVAAHIGRQPHEIMLKRQGERPFKDQLTLADYGVSNGVQLDLELDTGD